MRWTLALLLASCTSAAPPGPAPGPLRESPTHLESDPATGGPATPVPEQREPGAAEADPLGATVAWAGEFDGAGFVYVRIAGVSPDGHVWIQADNTNQVPRAPEHFAEIVEIDPAAGEVVSRWRETVGDADPERRHEFGTLWPLADSAEDVGRLARLATNIGPGHGLPVTLSPDGSSVLHHRWGDDRHVGDWLTLRDASGENPRRLDRGLVAAYSPAYSPDGAHVAFTGCKFKRGEGCAYDVYVVEPGKKPRAVKGLGHVRHVSWTQDGSAVLTFDDDGKSPQCLRKFTLNERAPVVVACAEGMRDAKYRAHDSARGAILGYEGVPGEQTLIVRFVDPSTGDIHGERWIDRGYSIDGWRDDDLMLVGTQKGLFVARGVKGPHRLLGARSEGPVWMQRDGAAYMVRLSKGHQPPQRAELLRVHPDAWLEPRG